MITSEADRKQFGISGGPVRVAPSDPGDFRTKRNFAAGHNRILQCFPEQCVNKSIMLCLRNTIRLAIPQMPDQLMNARAITQSFLNFRYRNARHFALSRRIELDALQAGYSEQILVLQLELFQGMEQ